MLIAVNYDDKRVHISETQSNQTYYCPFCGVPMITKKGNIRQHHFAHSANHPCTDTWERSGSYDMTPWHNDWQSHFPKENQEVRLALGETKHRADILIDRTVVEFQHSIMSAQAFDNRNNFYFNLGYKVVWLFDLSDIFSKGALTYRCENDEALLFEWNNPKRAFNSYDVKSGCIDLFFQLSDADDNHIVRVLDVSEKGFESFTASPFMSKYDFLSYVGLRNGQCMPPFRDDLEKNRQYIAFCKKYSIEFNKQQERAVQAVEGANLLLAVPGSGKTTVLVARLGHMIINKGIDPNCILAITYNKKACEEMEERFRRTFGADIGTSITFSTINALSLAIYKRYCEKTNRNKREQIEDTERRKIIIKVLKEFSEDYPSENEILEFGQAITYIKNMMLDDENLLELNREYPRLSDMYHLYQEKLKAAFKMDFDDQMVFAHAILVKDPESLNYYRSKYKYICVDEAQDTSKIQHRIIQQLSSGNNIFMVGDEDQSVYGFRAAYPKALLNFRYDYTNPYIMRMELNYRSTGKIVEKAHTFISKNKGRYEKHMTAAREAGDDVKLIHVRNREEQYKIALDVARNNKTEIAFLYRDNESAIVLVDLFLRHGICFKLRAPEMNYFKTKVVLEIIAYLKLSVDPYDFESFDRICNKGILYLKKQQKEYVIADCEKKRMRISDALEKQMQYVKREHRDRASKFQEFVQNIGSCSPEQAIDCILENGYDKYIEEQHYDYGKIDILKMLAKKENDIKAFLNRLKYLETRISNGFMSDIECPVVLSTIHSSKGLEYDTVYMVDVYDGRFPSSRPCLFSRSKDNADGEQEERRLFYVGITRAKNHLYLFNIDNLYSSFVGELFPEIESQHEAAKRREFAEKQRRQRSEFLKRQEDMRRELQISNQEREREYKERLRAEEKERKRQKEATDRECKEEILSIIDQQDYPARDSHGRRWVRCEKCGEVKLEEYFPFYGGTNHINLGICYECSKSSRNEYSAQN